MWLQQTCHACKNFMHVKIYCCAVSFPLLSHKQSSLVYQQWSHCLQYNSPWSLYTNYTGQFCPVIKEGVSLHTLHNIVGFNIPHNNEVKVRWHGEALLQHNFLHGGHDLGVGKGVVHYGHVSTKQKLGRSG